MKRRAKHTFRVKLIEGEENDMATNDVGKLDIDTLGWGNPLLDRESLTVDEYLEIYKSRITQDSEKLFLRGYGDRHRGYGDKDTGTGTVFHIITCCNLILCRSAEVT